jgi:hypothetical protein
MAWRKGMTKKELELAAFLLNRAADEFSNHGCNDIDSEIVAVANFTPEEEAEFCKAYRKWNGDDDGPEKLTLVGDYSLMAFLAGKLLEESQK